MGWHEQGRRGQGGGFPRVRARLYELHRAAELAAMNAEMAENGKGAGHRFRYQQLTAELAEIEQLLAFYEAGQEASGWRSWSAWQSWVLLLAMLGSVILSVLALLGALG